MELDWLKKKLACSTEDLRSLVDRDHAEISIRRQCELLGANRAGLYYQRLGLLVAAGGGAILPEWPGPDRHQRCGGEWRGVAPRASPQPEAFVIP